MVGARIPYLGLLMACDLNVFITTKRVFRNSCDYSGVQPFLGRRYEICTLQAISVGTGMGTAKPRPGMLLGIAPHSRPVWHGRVAASLTTALVSLELLRL